MAKLNFSQSLLVYLDTLRKHKHMTQEELTNDIVSMRQYRRYLRGESNIAPYVFDLFTERLGLNLEYVVIQFKQEKFKETKLVNAYHNAVINHDQKTVLKLQHTLDISEITDLNNRRIYQYATYLYQYDHAEMSEKILITSIKSLLDYPKILTYKVFSSAEIIILTSLLIYDSFEDKKSVVNLLTSYLNDTTTIISGHNQKMVLLCYYHLANYHKQYDQTTKMLDFALRGINTCKQLKYHYLLEDFYLLSALAYQRLEKNEQIPTLLFGLYSVLRIENNKAKTKRYETYIERDFSISDFDTFIINYLST